MIRAGIILLLGWGIGIPAWGHGVNLGFAPADGIEVQARYDSGEPMAGAQVTVFAPGDPQTPWLSGQTDAQGRFWFRPDAGSVESGGSWQVRIRQGGHGGIVTIPVAPVNLGEDRNPIQEQQGHRDPEPTSPSMGTPSAGMRWIMAATWVWGLVGTAFFFSRRDRQSPHAPS